MQYFDQVLAKEPEEQFAVTMQQFMQCARACRETKLAERADANSSPQQTSEALAQQLQNKPGEDSAEFDHLVRRLRSEVQERADNFDQMNSSKMRMELRCDEPQNEVQALSVEISSGAEANQMLSSELGSTKRQLEDALSYGTANTELEASLEGMRRAALLQKVYNEFDLDGGGDVGEEELLELGRARRRLGQKSGEWTPRANRALVRKMGCNEQGML